MAAGSLSETSEERAQADDKALPVFLAFAGGGAKGLVHVGALKAADRQDVTICGVSGTSAGAIVATLRAAGFSADAMVDPVAKTTLLDELVRIDPRLKTAPDLFGPGGWRKVATLRRILHQGTGKVFGALALAMGFLLLVSFMVASMAGVGLAVALWVAWLVALVIAYRWLASRLAGLSQLDHFKDALGKLLSRKVFPDEPDRVVRMRDFGTTGLLPLKIVGSNLSTRRLTLFSAETTPDVPVAEAVAASISIPLVFEPQKIGGEVFVDGGLVSNLPAWPFDEERSLDPDTVTLAFEIADDAPPGEEIGHTNWLPAAIRTALFGSGVLNLRAVGRFELIALKTELDVLEFDLGKEAVFKQVEDATTAAKVELDRRLFTRPALYQKACETVVAVVGDILDGTPVVRRLPKGERRVRVSLAMPDEGHTRSLRLRYGAGYGNDLDERLLLPMNGSVVGRAWIRREECFEMVPLPAELALPGRVHRFRRQQVWQDMQWVLCIPIFREDDGLDADPAFVVSIDSNERPTGDEDINAFQAILWAVVIDSFDQLLVELKKLG